MSNLTERWRNMSKSELAALDVGTLWNAIDDLVDENERLNAQLDRAVASLNTPNPTGIVYTRAWLEVNG